VSLYAWLDPFIARRPFEGRTARRYAETERPAFGDLDRRLLERFQPELARARRVLDVGAGAGELAAQVAQAQPDATVIALEPSASFTRRPRPGLVTLRARGERLPLATGSADLAICMSSLRHLRDRVAALRELRRVVRLAGATYIVELDPEADRSRARRHRDGIRSLLARWTFDPLLLRSGPTARALAKMARDAGWGAAEITPDPLQPVFVLRLS
jgi:ubiquinone/menaquinone biosynthesis C-methylase UbiE